jgi:hypothetical protein
MAAKHVPELAPGPTGVETQNVKQLMHSHHAEGDRDCTQAPGNILARGGGSDGRQRR